MDFNWTFFWFLFGFGVILSVIMGARGAIMEKRPWRDGILPAVVNLAIWTATSYGYVAVIAWLGGWLIIIGAAGILLAFVIVVLGVLLGFR